MKLIKESLSGIIYHFCNFENVYHILMSNKMILTSAYNTTSDLKFQRGRLFYASFTRQYSGEIGYAKHMNDMFSSQIDKKTGKLDERSPTPQAFESLATSTCRSRLFCKRGPEAVKII
jgi:hypothetical protein